MTDPNDPARPLFSSTVEVKEIARIETLLRGKEHPLDGEIGFKGLHAPRWEDAATHFSDDDGWKIADEATLQKGRELYFELCFECHRAPFRDPEIAADHPDSFWQEINTDQIDNLPEDRNWITIAGERLLNVVQKPVAEMGTDPEQARVLTERRVTLPSYLGIDAQRDVLEDCGMKGDATLKRSFVVGLMAAVRKVEDQWLLHQGKALSPAEIAAIKSKLPNCPNPRVFVPMVPEPGSHADNAAGGEPKVSYLAKPHYRARPLDGIWATAPYLHNGSVPTLEDLLTPAADRPPTFCVGPVEFDPVKVGLTTQRPVDLPPLPAEEPECEPGLTKFDVTERGNSNRGHSFEGKKGEPLRLGVIGRGLKPNERASLIAYLKTL